jgi:transposase
VAGRARAVRTVEDAVQAVHPVGGGRHLGTDRNRIAGCRRRQRRLGLESPRRLDRGACPPARGGRAEKGLTSSDAARREALGKSRGGWTTKIHTIGDGRGRNLSSHLTPGQDSDTRELVRLLDAVAVPRPTGRPRKRLDWLCADKAYGSRANRRALRARLIPHDIPEKDDQIANRLRKGSRGGRPPTFRPRRYKQRNHIERLINRRKQFRAVATRYDKLACRYRATVQIADIFIWLRAKPDRRRSAPR